MRKVFILGHALIINGMRESGPAATGVILVQAAEQGLARDDIHVNARLVVLVVLAGKGAFCTVFLGHVVLLGGQAFS